MKVKYKGSAQSINNNDTYTVLDRCGYTDRYKIRNDSGCVEWYAARKFVEVNEKVDTSTAINSDLVNKIQRELKETEERLGVLRNELENAKNPPSKNILERATRKLGRSWINEVGGALDNLADDLVIITGEWVRGLSIGVSIEGDGIMLDRDYDWNITYRNGRPILLILDK
jgi:hypothetical protein